MHDLLSLDVPNSRSQLLLEAFEILNIYSASTFGLSPFQALTTVYCVQMFLLLSWKIIVTLENNPAIILNGTTALVTFCQGKWFKEHLHMSIEHFAMFRKLCLELHPSACPAKETFDSWFSLSLKEFEGEMFSDLCFGVAGRDFDGLRKEVSGWDEAGELLCGGVVVW